MNLSFNVRSYFHYDNDIFDVTGIQSKFEKKFKPGDSIHCFVQSNASVRLPYVLNV